MCRSRFTCTRQPDRYDVQPESQARVAIVTRQPDRYDVQPESQALLLCRRMHGSSRFATSPPYQRPPPIGQHPPTPRQSQPGLDWPSGVPGNARGADAHFWAGPPPPPPSVVGRNGRREEISRTSRRNSLFTAGPPPSTIAITPPPPPVGGRSCGCQGRIWFPVQPWSQHSPQQSHTHIGGLHLLRLEHIRLHRSLLSGSHFSPKLKCCHSNTTPSSRLPPAGRNGRCKYRLWAAHVVAH